MRRILHPDADNEFADAVGYYGGLDSELGVRFYNEIERLFREISSDPKRFRLFDLSTPLQPLVSLRSDLLH